MKIEVHELFPTPLWAVEISSAEFEPLNAKLKNEIESLITPRPLLPIGRNYQTSQDLHKRPAFADFVKLVETAASNIARSLDVNRYPMTITGCWANINPVGSSHPTHNHPNNYLSGVYYVAVPETECHLILEDPRPGIMMPNSQNGRFTSNSTVAEIRVGLMVFFPSWLRHNVPFNQGPSERISIAFNLMFTNFAETISAPMWTPNTGNR